MAGEHMTETSAMMTYSSVVARDSICLAFLITALNNIDVDACDIGNMYLHVPCKEKIWFEAGIECSEHLGKVMRVIHALYGLVTNHSFEYSQMSCLSVLSQNYIDYECSILTAWKI